MVTYRQFWCAYTAFRMANWVRALVGTLCDPKCVSDRFPEKAEAKVSPAFIDFWKQEFRVRLGFEANEDLPSHIRDAERQVLAVMDACRRKTVASLGEPLRRIEVQLVPILKELALPHEAEIRQASNLSWYEIERDLDRIAFDSPQDAWSTVNQLYNILNWAKALPVIDGPKHPVPAWRRLVLKRQASGDDLAELDGAEFRIVEGCMDLLEQLKAAEGDMVLGSTLKDTIDQRPDRLYLKLPPELQAIIDKPGKSGTGYRML